MNSLGRYASAVLVAATLMSAAGCASTTRQESTGEYIDDSVITAKVKAAIFDDPALKVAEVNVETYKGVVQLSGFVGSQSAADRAVSVTRGVPGVTSVNSDMRIK